MCKGDRNMAIKFVLKSVYTPKIGVYEASKVQFQAGLNEINQGIRQREVIIWGDQMDM